MLRMDAIGRWLGPRRFFWGTGAVLVCAHAGRIYRHELRVGIKGQCFENASKNTTFAPSPQTLVRRLPLAVSLGQIAPRYAGSRTVDDGINEQAVVGRRAADVPLPARQEILDLGPLVVA